MTTIRNAIIIFLGTATSIGCSNPSAAKAAKVQSFLNPLAGNWKVKTLDRLGTRTPLADGDATVFIQGDKLLLTELGAKLPGASGVSLRSAATESYTLQPDPENAGHCDFAFTEGANLGKAKKGLVEVGELLKIVIASEFGQPRPTTLAPNPTVVYLELTRGDSSPPKK